MPARTVTTYGPDGFDPSKPNNNVVDERTVEVPEDPEEVADRDFRAAVEKATSIAELKAALLGTNGPGAEPRRPTR